MVDSQGQRAGMRRKKDHNTGEGGKEEMGSMKGPHKKDELLAYASCCKLCLRLKLKCNQLFYFMSFTHTIIN